MFKKDARLSLEVLDVRVERVRDISEGDAQAEGFMGWYQPLHPDDGSTDGRLPSDEFKEYWNTIHKKKPEYQWEANPWVWMYEFKKIEKEKP